MAKVRAFPVALLVLATATVWFSGSLTLASVKAASGSTEASVDDPGQERRPWGPWGLLTWFHNDIIIASQQTYPVTLMIGFCGFGNVSFRKENGGNRYPNWLFGFPICFMAYTYAGATASDALFVPGSLRAMSNSTVFCVFTAWYLIIQSSETVYRFCLQKHVFIFLQTWWLCDATRASYCFLERSVSPPWVAKQKAVFCRGAWQCFIWCAAGPIFRTLDKAIRGEPLPKLEVLQPDSHNFLKYPLVCMFWGMIFYMVYLWKFTNCDLFSGHEHSKTMVECGMEHTQFYAVCTYIPCLLHIGRSYYNLYVGSGNATNGKR